MLRLLKLLTGGASFFLLVAATTAQGFDVEGSTRAYLSSTSADAIANTDGYVNTGYVVMLLDTVAAVLIAWLFLSRGWSRRWRELAEAKLKSPFARAFIYIPIYALVSSVLLFPLTWFSDFYTEHKYGLATQSFSAWFGDFLIEGGVTTLLFALFVGLLYLVIRRTQDNWWAWGSGLSVGFMLFALFISPVFIDPLFNEYRPMDEGPLKERILSIARANGMEVDDVKQVDASRQTNRVSANVSGLFGTARIALNDNLLNRADVDSVEAVMAHEIGHYVLNHPIKMMLALLPILLALFLLSHVIFRALLRRKGEDWGVRGIDDYAGFPLLVAILTVVGSLATPVFYRVVYVQEYEADLFAINATQNPDAWAEVALLTAEYRKLEPSEFEENWFNHHPSPYMRIYMAMRWKAEHLPGEAPDEVE
ncbi:Zn-dependent protease with chaperone function [Congregibacter litoralis KT71]|uniref:Zn-dependent protease with chaperone function n=2 Tax=Congregibacter TaxID=393661 RepID=A4AAX6_9GAMM|nr:Zn-dependent protease with chaperone function [Congregibacter litoralis KT71]